MNKEIDTKTLGIIGGVFMFVVSLLLFFFVWNTTRAVVISPYDPGSQYQSINITSEKKLAEELINGKGNLSGMPISAPKADAIGQENPF